jgi:FkbM family methyltransferase
LRPIQGIMQSNSFVTNLYRGVSKRIKSSFVKKSKTGLTWLKEKYLKHATAGPIRSYQYQQKKFYYSSPSEFLHNLHEIFDRQIYRIQLPSKAFIIDCGANIGMATIYFKELCPDSEIIAFEPDDRNFLLLEKNIRSFDLKNVSARKEAVWIEDTTLTFSGSGTMGGRIENETNTSGNPVKAIRLKSLLHREVDLLKIDIEGAEYAVMKDIENDLPRVRNLFLEYHGRFSQQKELTDLFTLLQNAGFNYYIKEAAEIYPHPFEHSLTGQKPTYDVQLNIFCFRN